MPIAHSGKVVSREFILGHGIASMQIPFDMGSFRKLKERAEGAKQTAYCVDVVFNPFIVQLFTDDAFNSTMAEYRPFIINLVLARVESSIGVKLSTQKVKLVKKFLYKDGEGANCDIPRELTDLPQEIDDVENVPFQPPRNAPSSEPPSEPLIQDVTPGKKKSAVKKGFLNNVSAPLYPEGSKEGVVPENAGDPLGYLPKKLRNSCKVVDCNSPEYQENHKKQKAAEEHNKMNKEFSDMLTQDLGAWSKPGNQWAQDDLPDGIETSATQKYDVDYSRFDKMGDAEDDKPEIEERDWYYDDKGVRHSHCSRKASQSKEGTEPAIKKGFLDSAKTPLYPKGSEQRAPPDEAELMKSAAELMRSSGSEDELMKNLGKFMGEEGLPEPQAKAPQVLKPTINAKVPERKAAEFTLERDENEGLLQLVVAVPGLESMQGVDLDVTETCASLAFPSAVALRPLKVELPAAVIPTNVRAKFSRKTRQITVKLPLLLKVAKAG